MRPWADLPLDRDIRLAAVLAAQAIAETRVHDKKTHVPCACGCGQRIKKFDKYGNRRRFMYRHGNTAQQGPGQPQREHQAERDRRAADHPPQACDDHQADQPDRRPGRRAQQRDQGARHRVLEPVRES